MLSTEKSWWNNDVQYDEYGHTRRHHGKPSRVLAGSMPKTYPFKNVFSGPEPNPPDYYNPKTMSRPPYSPLYLVPRSAEENNEDPWRGSICTKNGWDGEPYVCTAKEFCSQAHCYPSCPNYIP